MSLGWLRNVSNHRSVLVSPAVARVRRDKSTSVRLCRAGQRLIARIPPHRKFWRDLGGFSLFSHRPVRDSDARRAMPTLLQQLGHSIPRRDNIGPSYSKWFTSLLDPEGSFSREILFFRLPAVVVR